MAKIKIINLTGFDMTLKLKNGTNCKSINGEEEWEQHLEFNKESINF